MPIVVFLHGGAYVRGSPEHSKWRGRLSTGETEQHGPNNGFGRFSKRLKRNCSLGDHPPAA